MNTKIVPLHCRFCNKRLFAVNTRRYCSPTCRQAAYRRRLNPEIRRYARRKHKQREEAP